VAGNFCMMERTEIKGWHYYYGDQLLDLCTWYMKEVSALYQNVTYLQVKCKVDPVRNWALPEHMQRGNIW
jgi:hypothetical protein